MRVFLALMIFMLAFPTYAQNFTGDGLKGKSIAILPFNVNVVGLDENLSDFLVGDLAYIFKNYSAMDVPGRDGALKEIYEEVAVGYNRSEVDNMWANMSNKIPHDFWVKGYIGKIGTNYQIQVEIIRKSDNNVAAIFSGNTNLDDLNNFVATRRASLVLLERMGITLTAQAKTKLSKTAETNIVDAQRALAQSIVAQRQGRPEAEVRVYLDYARSLDTTLLEAVNRSSIISANASGSTRKITQNDIAWRREWVNRLTEAEQFFNKVFNENSVPYTLFYSTEIIPGAICYRTETQHLSINTNLLASGGNNAKIWLSSVEKTLQQLYDELNATQRKNEWGLQNWPWTSVSNIRPFGNKNANFNIVAELENENGKVIGRTEFQSSGQWGFNGAGRPRLRIFKDEDRKQVRFASVKADDISDNITIKIKSVNGMSAENAAKSGLLQMKPVSKTMWQNSLPFKIRDGEITAYNGNSGDLVIPSVIWGEQVTSIGEEAFQQKRLTSVRIPNGVVSIGNKAFANNRLTNVNIPNSVTSIGEGAFANNQLTSVTIPNSVRIIRAEAFAGNQQLNRVTIGEKVAVDAKAFDKDFARYYYSRERHTQESQRAGTYAWFRRAITKDGRVDYEEGWRVPRIDPQTLNESQRNTIDSAKKKRRAGASLMITGLTAGVAGATMMAISSERFEADENGNRVVKKEKNRGLHSAGIATIGGGVGIFFIGAIPFLKY